MGRHVGECIRIQQEPSSRLDDVCDTIKTCGIAHYVVTVRGCEWRANSSQMKLLATDVLARRMGEVRVKGLFDVAPVNVWEVAGSVSDFLACLWGAQGTFYHCAADT